MCSTNMTWPSLLIADSLALRRLLRALQNSGPEVRLISSSLSLFFHSWVACPNPSGEIALYGALSDTAEFIDGPIYQLDAGGCILKNPSGVIGFPVFLIDPDLHFTYPPPYRVEKQ